MATRVHFLIAACALAMLIAGCAPTASAPDPLDSAAASDAPEPDPAPVMELMRVEDTGGTGKYDAPRQAILRVTNVGPAPVYYSGDRADLPRVSLTFMGDPNPRAAYFYCGVSRRTFEIKPGASVEFRVSQHWIYQADDGVVRLHWDARPVRVGLSFGSAPKATRYAEVTSDEIDFRPIARPAR